MKKILDLLTGNTVKSVGNVIDNLTTTKEEKLKAKEAISGIVLNSLGDLAQVQSDVIKSEMNGSWLQRNWRPILMLTFGFILVSTWFGFTDDKISIELEMKLLDIVQIGLGGYVIGRSVEKVAKTISKDSFPFKKKKETI